MATLACWKDLSSDRKSIPWVSERIRNRVLTKAECLVYSMMLSFLPMIAENVCLCCHRSAVMNGVGDKNVPKESRENSRNG